MSPDCVTALQASQQSKTPSQKRYYGSNREDRPEKKQQKMLPFDFLQGREEILKCLETNLPSDQLLTD